MLALPSTACAGQKERLLQQPLKIFHVHGSTFLFGLSSSMRMVTLEDEVKEIEIQPGLKPGSSECWLPLQVLGTECIVAGLS